MPKHLALLLTSLRHPSKDALLDGLNPSPHDLSKKVSHVTPEARHGSSELGAVDGEMNDFIIEIQQANNATRVIRSFDPPLSPKLPFVDQIMHGLGHVHVRV